MSSPVARAVVVSAFAGWLTATVAGNHPLRTFDRTRELARSRIAIPDWRFFAPEPSRWDTHLLYRVQEADGVVTPWQVGTALSSRHWSHGVWFPKHRFEKALLDVTGAFTDGVRRGPGADDTVAHRLIAGHLRALICAEYAGRPTPRGFQFVVVKDGGYDNSVEPDYEAASGLITYAPDAD